MGSAKVMETEVLVIGSGAAGLAAALSAVEAGADVTLLYKGPTTTAISTGFITFAAHDNFTGEQLYDIMFDITGKQICDRALLDRFITDGPKEIGAAIKQYDIPFDNAPRGIRVRRAAQRSGRQLVGDDYTTGSGQDMTALVMEFSATHGTSLFSQLLKGIKASKVRRVKGKALRILSDGPYVEALIDSKPVTISAGAVILASGGVQGLYEFTDAPANLTGEGHVMALEAGASLIDMEFIQFYPLALAEKNVPTIFIYPDFPQGTNIVNDAGEDLVEKHFSGDQVLGTLDNWDDLSIALHREIMEGQNVYLDFSNTRSGDWDNNSLTRLFLTRYVDGFLERPIRVAPIAHYTIGGVRTNVNGETVVPGLYAVGEVAGGLHGANRHGGTALAECLIFGRIAGRHGAARSKGYKHPTSIPEHISRTNVGKPFEDNIPIHSMRHLCQMALGPLRTYDDMENAAGGLREMQEDADEFGWTNYDEYSTLTSYKRDLQLIISCNFLTSYG